MKGDLRCIDGRLWRHDPQHDDPDLETDVGECPDCSGDGCGDEPGVPVSKVGRSSVWFASPSPPQETIMSEAENPPAFPREDYHGPGQRGMSLRDWFATHALGMGFDWTNLHQTGGYAEAAQVAYEIADAMLRARGAS